jgi:hypothetical protein
MFHYLILSPYFLITKRIILIFSELSKKEKKSITARAFSQVSETQGTQNDKTNTVAIAVVFAVLRNLRGRCHCRFSLLCNLREAVAFVLFSA